jgi:hypothetical protein
MKLHENVELFRDAVTITAQEKGIPEIYIEKDYWVTLALYTIFKSEIGSQVVFKGGTALAKCFDVIERFSEDIDLVVLKSELESGTKLKNKIKLISESLKEIMPEVETKGITNKMGMIRKTAHSYPKTFEGKFGQVRDTIILESTWLGSFEPYTSAFAESFISEMMRSKNQVNFIEEYNLQPFQVQVLRKERTLCEKIMSLMRFSFTENPIIDLNNKIRHIYDIHQMLLEEEIAVFFESNEFDVFLTNVAKDDLVSFKNNNGWLSNHPSKAIIYSDVKNTWDKLSNTYRTIFKELVYGELPSEEKVLKTLFRISERLEKIEWKIGN